jgi:hypothetical protein
LVILLVILGQEDKHIEVDYEVIIVVSIIAGQDAPIKMPTRGCLWTGGVPA